MDDWFTEETPEETLHDLYTRRLVAWGWVTRHGECSWDRTGMRDALREFYVPTIRAQLDSDLAFMMSRRSWTLNPEAPA